MEQTCPFRWGTPKKVGIARHKAEPSTLSVRFKPYAVKRFCQRDLIYKKGAGGLGGGSGI
jgi:hypothetical protein